MGYTSAAALGNASFLQLFGLQRTLELIHSGRLLSGREAASLGLVSRNVASSGLLEWISALAQAGAAGPRAAFAASKPPKRKPHFLGC